MLEKHVLKQQNSTRPVWNFTVGILVFTVGILVFTWGQKFLRGDNGFYCGYSGAVFFYSWGQEFLRGDDGFYRGDNGFYCGDNGFYSWGQWFLLGPEMLIFNTKFFHSLFLIENNYFTTFF